MINYEIIRRRRPGAADLRGASAEQMLQPDSPIVTVCAVASLGTNRAN